MVNTLLPTPEMLTAEIHVWTMRSWKELITNHPQAMQNIQALPIEVKAWMSIRLAKAFTVYDERGRPIGMEHPKENLIYRFDWQEGPVPGEVILEDPYPSSVPVPNLDLFIRWDTPIGPAMGGLVSHVLNGLPAREGVNVMTYDASKWPPRPAPADVTKVP